MPPRPIPLASSPRPDSFTYQAALSGSPIPTINQIPNRFGSPLSNSPLPTPASSSSLAIPSSLSRSLSAESLPRNATVSIEDLTEAQKAAIVRKHLLTADDQRTAVAELSGGLPSAGGSERRPSTSWTARTATTVDTNETINNSSSALDDNESALAAGAEEDNTETFPTPYHLPGGDVVADLYKWAQQERNPSIRRSKSLISVDRPTARRVSRGEHDSMRGQDSSDDDDGMRVREILEPGGFRRDFVIRKMSTNGLSVPNNERFTRSFVDFLSLFGHFAGEDLEEIEEGEGEEEEEEDRLGYEENAIPRYVSVEDAPYSNRSSNTLRAGVEGVSTERSSLVRRSTGKSVKRYEDRRSMSRRRSGSVGDHGDATTTQAVLMLLKSFVGTGVLFLGKAFYNGGMIFSIVVLMFIAMISLYSFLLLVRTRLVVHGSFGDIGGMLYGKYMRWMILFSIVLSQIGFVAAYTIFVAQNLQAFVMAITNCRTLVALPLLIFAQVIVFLPLAMIRNIQKLSGTALVADAFILIGLIYIFSNEIKVLADHGLADIQLFNANDFPLLIGTAVFAFEGIGLVIPITESMKDPHQFPRVLTGVMMGVMILFAGAGVLAYAAYGSSIQTVVFVNLPQSDRFVNASQLLYSLAILLSTPLQLFPAVRIMENGIFSRSGKYSDKIKWEKNVFRGFVVFGSTLIAWVGANDLDKFVSLIGSVACVPLCFCYPALLHYKACAVTRRQKIADIALFLFGVLAMLYTTTQTIKLLAGAPSSPPVFGNCPSPGI